jgi:Mg2+ and Co2+ transporter CorA
VHPLTLEDATKPRREPGIRPHFPKVEEFPNYLFVVVNPLTPEFLQRLRGPVGPAPAEDFPATQLSAVRAEKTLITHHCRPVAGVGELRAFLGRHESSREMVSDMMQTHLSAMSNKPNEIVKVLTMISTAVLRMTLVAGIYGLNFAVLPEKDWHYSYPFALGPMASLGVGRWASFAGRSEFDAAVPGVFPRQAQSAPCVVTGSSGRLLPCRGRCPTASTAALGLCPQRLAAGRAPADTLFAHRPLSQPIFPR